MGIYNPKMTPGDKYGLIRFTIFISLNPQRSI